MRTKELERDPSEEAITGCSSACRCGRARRAASSEQTTRAAVNGKDLRKLPLIQRKKILRAIVPKRSSVVLCAQHLAGRGRKFFAAVCAQDLEGIVAKRKDGRYDATQTQWLKIKNAEYSQARDRHELFVR